MTHLTTSLPILLGLSSLLTTALSQSSQTTWAAVTFTYHGEKTPNFGYSSPYDLTPLGAHQLYNAGQGVRNRYISSLNISQSTVPINGLSVNEIQNQQLYILGTDDAYVSASATAFMQGLYPPNDFPNLAAEYVLGNGTRLQYPLNGYQYPNIGTVSSLDFNYISIAGNMECTEYSISRVRALSSPAYVQKMQDTAGFYASLHDSIFSDADVDTLNYGNAYDIYESALYEYNHNETIQNSSAFTAGALANLRSLASEQQWGFNTPNGTDLINSISGQTLASRVLQQFSTTIDSNGVADKLTLLFGSYEPFLAFFALSNLATGPSAGKFTTLPDHGSTMTFELFSYTNSSSGGQNLTTPMPDTDGLYVRFLFRNGSEPESPFVSYALFDRGNSEDIMSWGDFVEAMGSFSLDDLSEWCLVCQSLTLFCDAVEDIEGNTTFDGVSLDGSQKKGVSPAVGGVIGAAVTSAAFISLVAGLLLAGFRLERRGNGKRDSGSSSMFGTGDISALKRSGSGNGTGTGHGGFKGADRLDSDTDLAVKSGAGATIIKHERVGSWEMNESPKGDGKMQRSLDKEIESGRVRSFADYGRRSEELNRENPFVDPVKPIERV